MVLSALPLAKILLSGLKAIELTQSECPLKEQISRPVFSCQILIVLCSPLTSVCPFGLIATEFGQVECPVRVELWRPVFKLQSLIVLSSLALMSVCPSG
jgi:hypothetical protein